MRRFQGFAMALVVAISASATTHLSVNTEVSFPCTVSPSADGTSAVTCTQTNETAQVSYVTNSDGGDMIMTVEF
ncbi:MAG TPA: hypothetical protein VFW28_19600 [Micropepsaceae bacterium]|nr:hypothetical protein [Micropepsaceae bacterium]